MAILAVEDLTFTYPLGTEPALRDVSFRVERGDFMAVCGATGSGKSTLLRLLKRELAPNGTRLGRVLYEDTPLEDLPEAVTACRLGFVMQRPEQQLVTDKVWHELAFGLENMALPTPVIRRRVSEMACYFGIEDWFEKSVAELSGGQKQLLNLAAVMVMQPDVLLLDEPTAQLDPIAASDFIATLSKLNRELGLTILLVEHRLEEVIPASTKLLALEDGRVLACGETRATAEALRHNEALGQSMPTAVRLYSALGTPGACPLTVREGRQFIESHFDRRVTALPEEPEPRGGETALEFRDVYFRYRRDLPDVLRGLSFTVRQGEIFTILGGNGSGKSTTLAAAAGLNRIYAGSIRVFGKKLQDYHGSSLRLGCLALLPQDVQTVFLRNTVGEELAEVGADPAGLPFDLTPLLGKHPYDLSGGQQQLVALAKILAAKPRLLLLDEPTKGLDAYARRRIVAILRSLRDGGMTIVLVTHDVEFAALCADRCAMFFRGEITSGGTPRAFFSGNSFYTTAANRMTRGWFDNAVTLEDTVALCRQNERGR